MLPDRKDERLAARLEDLGYGYTDGITAAVRKSPERNQKDPQVPRKESEGRDGEETSYLLLSGALGQAGLNAGVVRRGRCDLGEGRGRAAQQLL